MKSITLTSEKINQLEGILGKKNLRFLIAIDENRKEYLFNSTGVTAKINPPSHNNVRVQNLTSKCFEVPIIIDGVPQTITICFP